eukprot:SAG22_NODE_175_length_16235_cov_67.112729_16_plen_118_part_00
MPFLAGWHGVQADEDERERALEAQERGGQPPPPPPLIAAAAAAADGSDGPYGLVRHKALPLPCVSTVFLSETVPFHAVLHNTPGARAGGRRNRAGARASRQEFEGTVFLLCFHCLSS